MPVDNAHARETALILLEEVEAALAHGTKHYNAAGELLTTSREIVACLLDEGRVTFSPAAEED